MLISGKCCIQAVFPEYQRHRSSYTVGAKIALWPWPLIQSYMWRDKIGGEGRGGAGANCGGSVAIELDRQVIVELTATTTAMLRYYIHPSVWQAAEDTCHTRAHRGDRRNVSILKSPDIR